MGGVKQEQSDGPGSKGFHHSDSTQEDVRILTGPELLCIVITIVFEVLDLIHFLLHKCNLSRAITHSTHSL